MTQNDPLTHNRPIVTPYNLGRHNLETLYHQKGKEGSLLSIFRQNTKHFFDKNIPFFYNIAIFGTEKKVSAAKVKFTTYASGVTKADLIWGS